MSDVRVGVKVRTAPNAKKTSTGKNRKVMTASHMSTWDEGPETVSIGRYDTQDMELLNPFVLVPCYFGYLPPPLVLNCHNRPHVLSAIITPASPSSIHRQSVVADN